MSELVEEAERAARDAATWADLSNFLFNPVDGLVAKAYPRRAAREAFLQTDEYPKIRQLVSDARERHGLVEGATPKLSDPLVVELPQPLLLESTLTVWGGEFGRQPVAEYVKGTGRDHNAYSFTMWLAGGGIKGGIPRRPDRRTGQRGGRRSVPRQAPARYRPAPARPGPEPAALLLQRPEPEAGRGVARRPDRGTLMMLDRPDLRHLPL